MVAETSTKSDSKTSSDDSQNPSSPNYLHPGENPRMVLINVQLDGGNYHAWSRGMKRALLSKNKHKFVDGSILITKTVNNQIAQSIVYIENARELWEDLWERFSKGDHFRISDLLQEIHSMRQGKRNVTEFFTELKTLWEELESLRPTPDCVCKIKYSCALIKSVVKHRESEYVLCFLEGFE
ncbi:uncharacterized protein [Phaseolus vulgaris]|uniref:uncharacterized protein n=1 Tax=Phaseolus vulgaris TaxID=3885 RepID=UPI0035C9709B